MRKGYFAKLAITANRGIGLVHTILFGFSRIPRQVGGTARQILDRRPGYNGIPKMPLEEVLKKKEHLISSKILLFLV